ncbi:CAP-Gly protein [Sodalis sp. dw_96]|uniref:CAP-Gly protein n=1 Tax=Sodalis sp. dw_96 TaxID=2719794 RepID=UPI001BD4C256|nr:CAP-Gly protein [Sodalis sp. dw_96]
METHTVTATPRITSWGAIISGVITVLAMSVLLSILGTALGFSMVEPYSEQPVQGVGTVLTVWSFVSILVSLACGGYVAGRLAGAAGISHGFLVWATSLIIAIIISSMIIGGALRAAGSLIGSLASATGHAASGMVSSLSDNKDNMQGLLDDTMKQMGLDTGLPPDQTPKNVLNALQNSNIEALKPDYLSQQLSASEDDVQATINAIRKSPDSFNSEMDQLSHRLKQRANGIPDDINRDDVHQALARRTSMSPDEVNQATDSVIRYKQQATAEVKERLEGLEQDIDRSRAEMQQWKEQATQQADAAAKTIAKSAVWSFIALLIGAVVGAYCGLWGAKTAHRYAF